MGRSARPDLLRGLLLEDRLRLRARAALRAASPSRGTFRTYLFRVQGTDLVVDPDTGEIGPGQPATTDYDIDWNALQMLPGKVRAIGERPQVQRPPLPAALPGRLQHGLQPHRALVGVAREGPQARRPQRLRGHHQHLLRDRLHARQRAAARGLACAASRARSAGAGSCSASRRPRSGIQFGDADHVDHWSRFDVAPTVSRPFSLSFLDFNPSVGYRYTRYGASHGVDEDGESAIVGPPLDRSFVEAQVELRGPTFSRVFDTPGLRLLGALQAHDRARGLLDLPDAGRRLRRRSRSSTGTTTTSAPTRSPTRSCSASGPSAGGPTGRLVPYEFFSWRLMQTYYVQIADGAEQLRPQLLVLRVRPRLHAGAPLARSCPACGCGPRRTSRSTSTSSTT